MKRLANLIESFAHAEGPPPERLGAFLRWALAGAFPVIGGMLVISVATGVTEVGAAWLVGWLIDHAQSLGPEALLTRTSAIGVFSGANQPRRAAGAVTDAPSCGRTA